MWLRLLVFHHDTGRKKVCVCVCGRGVLRCPCRPNRLTIEQLCGDLWSRTADLWFLQWKHSLLSPYGKHSPWRAGGPELCGMGRWGGTSRSGLPRKWGKPSWSHLKKNNPSCKQGNMSRKIIRRRVCSSRFNCAGVIFVTLRISAILQRWENGASGARTARYGCAETNTEEERGVVRASCGPSALALVSAEGLFLGQDG